MKGKAEPVRVYRTLGEVSAPARATMVGPRTPFVGRDEEMTDLLAALAAVKDGRGSVITLEAPVGTGKSRMVLELRGDAEDRGLATLSARAAAFGQGSPFAPWSDLVNRAANLGTLATAAARERLHAWLDESLPDAGVDARWLDEIANVADASDPEIQRRREQPARFRQGLLDALITWLWAWSKKSPLVVFAEDVHWWPAPSLELLVGAAQVARKAPLLLVATRRPEPTAVEWPPEKTDRVVTLGPLDDAALLTLAHGVLGSEVPRGLLTRLQSVTGGNPFFAEEVIQAYIDNGALKTSRDRGGWTWDEARAQQAALPMTVEGVTQARIDALPARERHVLQMAAVAGRTFWLGLLEAMGEEDAYEALLQLSARDLVHARRSRLAGEKEYAFKHATIQAVAYENALKRERVNDHRKVAEWLEARAGDSTELATTIAEHYLVAEEKAKALPHLLKAAEEAVRVFARLDDAEVVEHAVSVAESVSDAAARGNALRLRGRLRRIAGDPRAIDDLRGAMAALGSIDPRGHAMAGRDLAGYLLQRGKLDEVETIAGQVLAVAREVGSHRIEVEALNQLAVVARRRGDLPLAQTRYDEALAIAEREKASDHIGLILVAIGNLQLETGRPREAAESFQRALATELSPENATILKSNLGAALLDVDDVRGSLNVLEEALQAARAIGLRWAEAEVLVRRGAAKAQARSGDGLAELDEGIDLARRLDAAEPLVEGLWRRARVRLSSDPAGARADLVEARKLAVERGDRNAMQRVDALLQRAPGGAASC